MRREAYESLPDILNIQSRGVSAAEFCGFPDTSDREAEAGAEGQADSLDRQAHGR